MTKIKHCPFCNEPPIVFKTPEWSGISHWVVMCENQACPMETIITNGCATKEDAIIVWNTRKEK